MSNVISAWVVDSDATTLLFDQNTHTLVAIDIAKSLLDTLKPYSYAYLNHRAFDVSIQKSATLPKLVIDYHALKNLGLFKINHDKLSFNGNEYRMTAFRQIAQYHQNIASHASHAIQVMRWRSDNRHCPRCAAPIIIHDSEYAACCSSCQHRSYPRVQPCIIVAITRINSNNKPEILLALHHRHKDGMHGLVAGFMEIGESIESAICREVFEEVSINVNHFEYIGSQAWPFPSNLMIGFLAQYASGEIKIQQSELADAKFFDFDDLPKIPNHGTIARDLIEMAAKKYGKHISQPT